jgi:hypothetical protein
MERGRLGPTGPPAGRRAVRRDGQVAQVLGPEPRAERPADASTLTTRRTGSRRTGPEVIDSDGMQATRCSELRMIADIAPLCERTLQ